MTSAASRSGTSRVRCVADGFTFLEAPRWHDGRLYVSDFFSHRVLSFDAAGRMHPVCEVSGQPSGLGFMPDGSLLVVSMLDRRLLRLYAGRLCEFANLAPFSAFPCNDMIVHPSGRAYIGNFGWDIANDQRIRSTRLLLVEANGSVNALEHELVFPNGMVILPGEVLLVSETFAARVSQFDIEPSGALSLRSVWASFSSQRFSTTTEAVAAGVPLPDGLCLDAEGAVWMGDAAGRGALRVAPGGRILERVDTSPLTVFAATLGGMDGRTLYMCAGPSMSSKEGAADNSSALLACRVAVPAATMSS
ncbi:MAG TPA: SMP-30/gluconolactonase/LRE family protein [Steroidobacter sp.]